MRVRDSLDLGYYVRVLDSHNRGHYVRVLDSHNLGHYLRVLDSHDLRGLTSVQVFLLSHSSSTRNNCQELDTCALTSTHGVIGPTGSGHYCYCSHWRATFVDLLLASE